MTFSSRSPTTYVSAELCLVNSYDTYAWHGDACTCSVLVHVLVVIMYSYDTWYGDVICSVLMYLYIVVMYLYMYKYM